VDSIRKDNLKIKSEVNIGVSVEDLIQMSIWSFSEFVSVYRICMFSYLSCLREVVTRLFFLYSLSSFVYDGYSQR
jgi:hypothetical protein